MIDTFRGDGLNAILDFVPNHMGVGGADNPLWLDVLEWGPELRYAGWFDIDWGAGGGKLLAPVLGAQYSEELREGKLALNCSQPLALRALAYVDQPKSFVFALPKGKFARRPRKALVNRVPIRLTQTPPISSDGALSA